MPCTSAVIRFVAFCRDFGGRFPRSIGLQNNFRDP